MLVLKNITRIYKPKRGVPVRALNNVSLSFSKTGMVFILGKSGSGKSTFLNVVGGLDKYDEGELIVKDKSTLKFKQSDFDSYRNTMIGFIFQEYNVLDEFTVAQNIGLALELQGQKASNEKVNEILNLVDLEGYGSRRPNELSGGQKQRVAIARALVKNPEIIMADEPTGALDSDTGTQILETLKKLSATRLVIVVSHDKEFAQTYGDRIVEFKDGEVISDLTRNGSQNISQTPFTISNDILAVKEGYVLTNEDLNVINDYLKTNKKPLEITKQSISSNGETKFIATDTSNIKLEASQYIPIKSKLPFKSSLKIGASALKTKKFRLVLSIILAAVSFALFGLSDTMGTYEKHQAAYQSNIDSNYNFYYIYTEQNVSDGENNYRITSKFFPDELTALNTRFPTSKFFGLYAEDDYMSLNDITVTSPSSVEESIFYPKELHGFIEYSNELETSTNFTVVAGNKPVANEEIMITKHMYETFVKYGLRTINILDYTTSNVEVNNYNDIIGKYIHVASDYYKIVGIIDTKLDLSKYDNINVSNLNNEERSKLANQVRLLYSTSVHLLLFTNPGHNTSIIDPNIISNSNYMGRYFYITNNPFAENRHDLYIKYYGQIANIDLDNVTYFKNKNKTNLGRNDIIVNMATLSSTLSNYVAEFNDLYIIYDEYIRQYITTKPIAELKGHLNANSVNTDGYDDETVIGIFKNYFYDSGDYDLPAGYTEKAVLEAEKLVLHINSLNPIVYHYLTIEYNGSIEEKIHEPLNIVGVFNDSKFEDSVNNSTIYFSEGFSNFLKLEKQGTYFAAITFNGNNNEMVKYLVDEHFKRGNRTIRMLNEVMVSLEAINGLIEMLAKAFVYVGIGFAVFASLMLLNFITISVSGKKQEIGILRAIGARGKDVLGIFTKESIIIALINYVLALIMAIVAVININISFRNALNMPITLLNFTIRQAGFMLVVSVGVAIISSALPVIRTSRKRPIDAIRDR